jgi:hypothetical protein
MLVGTGASLGPTGSGSILATGLLAGTYGNVLTFSNGSNSFTGSGAGITGLNFANISGTNTGSLVIGNGGTLATSGTGSITATALAAGTYGNALTISNASNAITGTFSGSGAALTNLNAANIVTNTVATARLGSGTASSSTYLRGDQTWSTPFVGTGTLTINSPSQVGGGKCSDFFFTGGSGFQTTDFLLLKEPSLAGWSVTLHSVQSATVAQLRVCNGNANATPTGLTISYLIVRP